MNGDAAAAAAFGNGLGDEVVVIIAKIGMSSPEGVGFEI